MDVPENETPEAVKSFLDKGIDLLAAYGWTALFCLVVANLLWSHFYPKFRHWREQQENTEREAEYKKDPSLIIQREEAMARARQRLQEKHDQLEREHAEKMKEKEEKKRLEKIEAMEKLLNPGKKKTDSFRKPEPSLRPDYNPLMGSGGGSSFRGPRRGAGSGGG